MSKNEREIREPKGKGWEDTAGCSQVQKSREFHPRKIILQLHLHAKQEKSKNLGALCVIEAHEGNLPMYTRLTCVDNGEHHRIAVRQ